MSNIGQFSKNANGFYTGAIATLAVSMTLALREIHNPNPNAPVYEIHAKSVTGAWIKVGALWEEVSRDTGVVFMRGSIDDPSLAKPLYIACFRQKDGESYAIAWSRPAPSRNNNLAPLVQGMDEQSGLDFDGSATGNGNDDASSRASATGKKGRKGAELGESTSDAESISDANTDGVNA